MPKKQTEPVEYIRQAKTLTFDPILLERALDRARKERRSMSMICEIALIEYLDRVEKRKG